MSVKDDCPSLKTKVIISNVVLARQTVHKSFGIKRGVIIQLVSSSMTYLQLRLKLAYNWRINFLRQVCDTGSEGNSGEIRMFSAVCFDLCVMTKLLLQSLPMVSIRKLCGLLPWF